MGVVPLPKPLQQTFALFKGRSKHSAADCATLLLEQGQAHAINAISNRLARLKRLGLLTASKASDKRTILYKKA